MATEKRQVPVTVLTGFLGSGKTTLLNWILTANHGKRIAVIENEFGEVGVDDALVKKKFETDEQVFEMNNGCVCCTVRGDLIKVLAKLAARKTPLDAIILETTGLADPCPVAQTFFTDTQVKSFAKLDAVITVVDAKFILMHLDEEKPQGVENEAYEQVCFADRLLLNKIDLVTDEEKEKVKERLKSINKTATIVETQLSTKPVDMKHIMGIDAFSLEHVLKNVDPDFLNEDEKHEHDERISSIGFKFEGDVDGDKLNKWLGTFLQEYGNDIYRMKGVISIKGMAEKFVFQGVHMLFSGEPTGKWGKDEKRENRFIFIGKNLDKKKLETQFMACRIDNSTDETMTGDVLETVTGKRKLSQTDATMDS